MYNYQYDDEGNRTKRTNIATGAVTEYTWDHRNRLTKVLERASAQGPATKAVEYSYDVLNRRVTKDVDTDGDEDFDRGERYVYDGDNIVLQFDDDSTLTDRYLFGPGVDQVLADENGSGVVSWLLADHEGTIRDVAQYNSGTDQTTVVNHLKYDAFGNITAQSNSSFEPHFAFTGRDWDADSGLYYYRARWYDPATGRFLSQDPTGFKAGDTNLNRYVWNRPTSLTDPTGLGGSGSGGSAGDGSDYADYGYGSDDTDYAGGGNGDDTGLGGKVTPYTVNMPYLSAYGIDSSGGGISRGVLKAPGEGSWGQFDMTFGYTLPQKYDEAVIIVQKLTISVELQLGPDESGNVFQGSGGEFTRQVSYYERIKLVDRNSLIKDAIGTLIPQAADTYRMPGNWSLGGFKFTGSVRYDTVVEVFYVRGVGKTPSGFQPRRTYPLRVTGQADLTQRGRRRPQSYTVDLATVRTGQDQTGYFPSRAASNFDWSKWGTPLAAGYFSTSVTWGADGTNRYSFDTSDCLAENWPPR